MRVFLDTSVISDRSLNELAPRLAEQVLSGEDFLLSVLTHFQILWGYKMAGISAARYEAFLSKLSIDVAPLTEEDAALAAQMKPRRKDLVDALGIGHRWAFNFALHLLCSVTSR